MVERTEKRGKERGKRGDRERIERIGDGGRGKERRRRYPVCDVNRIYNVLILRVICSLFHIDSSKKGGGEEGGR